ncbi:MAG: transposase [Clostridia bacterium]|nr:transposase [Clostridia bacterium]
MEKELRERKKNRLDNYDYSRPGAYFLTLCTEGRRNYFWDKVGATIGRPQDVVLSSKGKIVDEAIKNIPRIYPAVTVDYYVIMPNHIHILLTNHADEFGRPMVAPTVDRMMQQMKGYVTKQIGRSIWQKLFFDHVIRNRQDYDEHVKYIHENPARWYYDELYSE